MLCHNTRSRGCSIGFTLQYCYENNRIHIKIIMPIFNPRHVVRLLFHNYGPEEGKGDTKCRNTLNSLFRKLGGGTHNGIINQNITFESFNQDTFNKSIIEGILKRVEEKARGKRHFIHTKYKLVYNRNQILVCIGNQNQILVLGTETKVLFCYRHQS
jgi:hypothetical protein